MQAEAGTFEPSKSDFVAGAPTALTRITLAQSAYVISRDDSCLECL